MGNSQGRILRANRKIDPEIRKQTIKSISNIAVQKVINAQQDILTKFKNDKTALITPASVVVGLSICETAKIQIQREGACLTKADLIAIIVALDATQSSSLNLLQSLSISELNMIIRAIIYNPSRYISFGNKGPNHEKRIH